MPQGEAATGLATCTAEPVLEFHKHTWPHHADARTRQPSSGLEYVTYGFHIHKALGTSSQGSMSRPPTVLVKNAKPGVQYFVNVSITYAAHTGTKLDKKARFISKSKEQNPPAEELGGTICVDVSRDGSAVFPDLKLPDMSAPATGPSREKPWGSEAPWLFEITAQLGFYKSPSDDAGSRNKDKEKEPLNVFERKFILCIWHFNPDDYQYLEDEIKAEFQVVGA